MKKSIFITFLFSCSLFSINSSAQTKSASSSRTDTLVFLANNFVIQPNDKLNDLLKRIPAISVDNKGKFFAQGDAIERILVDGSEFFTEDPGVAANVIRADKVDKIKIYYRWSDQSSFTGIDDNIKFKTINVIMKKEK
ncbi:MAG: hypothetical protein EOP47_03665 [Sphingobacteriaceae bacterium]|nr:MAG: hypothetical protein EOP47_03665 [Sphingobacteriaceae bacterium]